MKYIILLLILSNPVYGAFPTNPVLDTFDRANENPLANGNWLGPVVTTDSTMKILTNVAASAGTFSESYWNTRIFGPKEETYVIMSTKSANGGASFVQLRLVTPNTSGASGYEFDAAPVAGTDTAYILRMDNATFTQIGSTFTQEWAAGDSLGLEAIGNTITAYRKPAAGSWGSVTSATDTTYPNAGYISIGVNDATARLNDFGGGTIKVIKRVNNN